MKQQKGFAVMDKEKQRLYASRGGKSAHQKGTAYRFTSESAKKASTISVEVRKAKRLAREALERKS